MRDEERRFLLEGRLMGIDNKEFLLTLDVLLAAFHRAVWGACEHESADYDEAGREECKAIQRHVRTMLNAPTPVADSSVLGENDKCPVCSGRGLHHMGCYYIETGDAPVAELEARSVEAVAYTCDAGMRLLQQGTSDASMWSKDHAHPGDIPLYINPPTSDAAGKDSVDAALFRSYFTMRSTNSNALIDMELRALNGDPPSLDDWRSAIEDALTKTEKQS
jgi:hypothetical protein